jgi:Flp pilus assembly protein TadD
MDLGPEFTQMRRGILNNYAIPSMFNELSWALNQRTPFDEARHFVEVSNGKFIDIHLPPRIRPASLEAVRARRAAIINVAKRVVECSTIVMTLGLVEAWYDRETKSYINYAPPRMVTTRYPGRFELHVLDYKTSLDYLRRIVRMLKAKAAADHHILLTVSPVPLLATFTARDVLVANAYSKSLLRVVAEVVAGENDHIDYYPSYESVTLSDRKVTWKDDQHHVRDDVVAINVGRMIHAYSEIEGRGDFSVPEAISEARNHWRAKDPGAALSCLMPVADQLESLEDMVFYGEVCRAAGMKEEALRVALSLPDEGNIGAQISKADLLLKVGEPARALATVQAALDGTPSPPGRILAVRMQVRILIALKAYDEAAVAAKLWSQLSPARTEPLMTLAEIYRDGGKVELARHAYNMALERDPSAEKIRLDFAEFLITHKQLDDARSVLSNMEARTPDAVSRLHELNLHTAAPV